MKKLPNKTLFGAIILLGTTAVITAASAETYKCIKNGATTYSQMPCQDGVSIPHNIPNGQIPGDDYQDGLKRNKKDEMTLKRLETSRHKEEAKYEKEMKARAAKNEKATQKCDALKMKEKWAKEDMANASLRGEKKARLQYKRAIEKSTLYCKTH